MTKNPKNPHSTLANFLLRQYTVSVYFFLLIPMINGPEQGLVEELELAEEGTEELDGDMEAAMMEEIHQQIEASLAQ